MGESSRYCAKWNINEAFFSAEIIVTEIIGRRRLLVTNSILGILTKIPQNFRQLNFSYLRYSFDKKCQSISVPENKIVLYL